MKNITLKNIENLEIVGYCDVLTQETLPAIVIPIYCMKSLADPFFLPPYDFGISYRQLRSLEDSEEITLFSTYILARKEFDLWIDCSGQWYYQSHKMTRKHLDQIASEELEKCKKSFVNWNFDDAERFSSTVLLADENNYEALSFKIAIAKIRNDDIGLEILLDAYSASKTTNPIMLRILKELNR